MPCNADHMKATTKEQELSKVACLLDELDGKPIDSSDWQGYHPAVYGKKVNGDALVAELCTRLQQGDVTLYSLEMQLWWRDHQRADKKRLAQELQRTQHHAEREAALEKLTDYERQLLRL